jgi:hypothetical protein
MSASFLAVWLAPGYHCICVKCKQEEGEFPLSLQARCVVAMFLSLHAQTNEGEILVY